MSTGGWCGDSNDKKIKGMLQDLAGQPLHSSLPQFQNALNHKVAYIQGSSVAYSGWAGMSESPYILKLKPVNAPEGLEDFLEAFRGTPSRGQLPPP